MAQYSTAEAKKEFFLTTDDLRDLPKQSIYCGFGTGPPMKVYNENDLEEAALSKHGRAGLAKKRAAREKRESNKRKREEEAAAAVDPAVAKRNAKIVGRKWDLQITSPESVAGTKAELVFGCLPPTGWPGKSACENISVRLFYLDLSCFYSHHVVVLQLDTSCRVSCRYSYNISAYTYTIQENQPLTATTIQVLPPHLAISMDSKARAARMILK